MHVLSFHCHVIAAFLRPRFWLLMTSLINNTGQKNFICCHIYYVIRDQRFISQGSLKYSNDSDIATLLSPVITSCIHILQQYPLQNLLHVLQPIFSHGLFESFKDQGKYDSKDPAGYQERVSTSFLSSCSALHLGCGGH